MVLTIARDSFRRDRHGRDPGRHEKDSAKSPLSSWISIGPFLTRKEEIVKAQVVERATERAEQQEDDEDDGFVTTEVANPAADEGRSAFCVPSPYWDFTAETVVPTLETVPTPIWIQQ